VQIAPAKGWPAGGMPGAAAGVADNAFATALNHPRWVHVLPNGDLLVAETNAPPKPEDSKGIKGAIMKKVQGRAGAGTPSANRIILLRDADGDGVAETKTVFIANLHSPFGMALVGKDLHVANTDAVLRFPYTAGQTQISAKGVQLTDLPGGPINHHWTKNIIASPDGTKLYATAGSNSNVAENGMPAEVGRAAIHEIDLATGKKQLFATGLRSPNGMAWEPSSGVLWTPAGSGLAAATRLAPALGGQQHAHWPVLHRHRAVVRRARRRARSDVARTARGAGQHADQSSLLQPGLHDAWHRDDVPVRGTGGRGDRRVPACRACSAPAICRSRA